MSTTPIPPDGCVALAHWGLMRARGADAVSFLQGQLTNDLASMSAAQVRLAGFCSAKGRLQATFVVCRLADDDLLLACAASVLPATLKRLSMFVLRARCKLADASPELGLYGVAGRAAATLAGLDASALGGDAMPVWTHRAIAGGTLLRLPDVDGVVRCIAALAMPPDGLPALSIDAWRRLEVRSGLPIVEAATVDQFVPQMLNYELIGAVDFRKGCYPGQEVVARSQYRGTIKRRMFLFDSSAALAAGQDVFHSGDAAQPAGMVVNAAPAERGGSCALVEVKLAALDSGTLHAGSPEGALLVQQPLPYAVPVDASLPA